MATSTPVPEMLVPPAAAARPFRRVLIANRGEIAVRIIRACRELGLQSVQAYSTADSDSLAVRMADDSVCIGEPKASESYLNIKSLLDTANRTGCDAVHPGYGFLSENAAFATRVEAAGLVYVGPQPATIRLMGDKVAARMRAQQAGVPVIPGSAQALVDDDEAVAVANRIGYPVLIKAVAGGGGRGMRVAQDETELRTSMARASAEAAAAFGDGTVYVEKYLDRVRHVEVQVMGDGLRAIHLGERDCTIQRRHQKLLEEGPSPAITPTLRQGMLKAATDFALALGYRSAGTMEFIVDSRTKAYYFIEMNTRIQVEHPVTEMLTGLDLVKMQLAIAAGESLAVEQHEVETRGHSIECRINAEDPDKGFMPRAGRVTEFVLPGGPGVRIDTHAYPGCELPSHYDSLIAKVVTWGRDRGEAIARMKRALSEMHISGVKTTLPFHRRLLDEPAFLAADVHTRFVKEQMMAGDPMQHLL